jgi:hypothetical protein
MSCDAMGACVVEPDFELVQLLPGVPYLITRKLTQMTGEKMSVGTLEELLIDELKDLYSAEKQIIRALPKIIKAVSSPELQEGLSNHLEETKGQVSRLEKMGEILSKKMTGKTCGGMKGVLEEGSEVLEDTEKGYSARRCFDFRLPEGGALRNGRIGFGAGLRQATRAEGSRCAA